MQQGGAGGEFIAIVSSVTHCIILLATDLYQDFLVNLIKL